MSFFFLSFGITHLCLRQAYSYTMWNNLERLWVNKPLKSTRTYISHVKQNKAARIHYICSVSCIGDESHKSIAHSTIANMTQKCCSHYWPFPWWRHQMETFSALLAICAGNSPVPSEFPTQRPVTRSFDVFFDLRLNKNSWVNNREAGDLRRYRAHYDVIVMLWVIHRWLMGSHHRGSVTHTFDIFLAGGLNKIEHTVQLLEIWDAMTFMRRNCNSKYNIWT